MAVFHFTFDPRFAGQSAVVRDGYGDTVSGSPVALDANGSATLTLPGGGSYHATASAPLAGLNDAVATGVFDLYASIAAADNEEFPAFPQAAFVEDADPTDADSVAAAVDALRDALIAAGLMAAE